MKSLIVTVLALISLSVSLTGQYETSMFLYDTISEGPLIAPEKGGYNFIFKTQNVGTMVSTRGQVVNPAIPYDMFNHYHIQSDGTVDSIFAIPVRSEVSHHYTMYKRGAPKLLQFRIGSSNDYPISKIESKYPIIKSIHNNDEPLVQSKIDIENNLYISTSKTYKKGTITEISNKAKIALNSEEGTWIYKGHFSNNDIRHSTALIVYGKQIENDKDRKYNDLHEFKILSVDNSGDIIHEEVIISERAYVFHNSGIIHTPKGDLAGYYLTLLEAAGKANKDQNTAVQKVLLFDEHGVYLSETIASLPFAPKSKAVTNHRIVKIIKSNRNYQFFLHTSGSKKAKVAEGFYTFMDDGDSTKEQSYQKFADLNVAQDLRNKPVEMVENIQDYQYAEQLDNQDLLLIACENGTKIEFLHLDSKGAIKFASSSFLLNDVQDQKATLTFEHLDNQQLLIISKIAKEKSVRTSYAIYDNKTGKLRTIQPKETLSSIYSYRNGDEILVFGSSTEDINVLLFHLEKLKRQTDDGLTILGSK